MIKIKGLSFSYDEDNIINNINLEIRDNEYLLISGPNGAGKSTFIKCLVGINAVKHNQITIDNECMTCFKKYSKIGYVPQIKKKESELPLTPRELFSLIIKDKVKINSISEKMSITNLLDKNINSLSGGQVQKIYIAKALLHDVEYLILDEPTTGLDKMSQENLLQILKDLNEDNITIILVSHESEDNFADISAKFIIGENKYQRIKNV